MKDAAPPGTRMSYEGLCSSEGGYLSILFADEAMKRPSVWGRTYQHTADTHQLLQVVQTIQGYHRACVSSSAQVGSSAKRLAGYSCLSAAAQHFLYFLPLPHEQGAFGLGFFLSVGLVNARRGSLRMISSIRRSASVASVCPCADASA